jgi:thiol-disulfide isomerase/thioredoxin
MKLKLTLLLILLTNILFAQQDVPAKYWIEDSNFEEKINENHAFGDDDKLPVVVEFWASFNAANCFADWNKIENAIYYRVDISKAPLAKKEYRIRMAPTLIIFKDGIKEEVFKAGLDLVLPANLNEIQEAINEVNTASKF